MVRKNVILRYVLTFSLLFSCCVVGFGGSSAKAAAQCATQIRYIRDSINGNSHEAYNHWVEIQAFSGNVNVALHKKVTGSSGTPDNLAKVDDGDWGDWQTATCPNYTSLGTGPQWVQIDLGQLYKVDYVRVWHYYQDVRYYHNNVTQVSADGVTWVTLYNSDVGGELYEHAVGHTLQVAAPYAPASSSHGIPVRYIRDWVQGNTANSKDIWMEIAAYTKGGNNVALHKPVTADFTPVTTGGFYDMDKGLDVVTNGDYTTGDDTYTPSGRHYVQVDLGTTYDIDRVQVWHYYDDRFYDYRKFNFTTQVSTDGINWLSVYDSSISGTYSERSSGNIINLDISVSHPSSVHFGINPNNSTPFMDGEIPLKNNSDMPVKVYLQSLSDTSRDLKLNNVLPSAYPDWSKLTKAQTKSDAAFGVRIKEGTPGSGTWQSINQSGTVYTANMGKTLMGTLNAKGTGTLALAGNCGLAWDRQYTIAKNLSLIFSS